MRIAPALVLLLLVSCGVDKADAHDEIIEQLPIIEDTTLISIERSTSCSKDTCLWGDDQMTSVLTFSADGPTEREVIAFYVADLVDPADVQICDFLDDDPDRCVFEVDHRASASFVLDGWRLYVDTLDWSQGHYTVSVSAVIE